jgi:signal transduction histidine kinase
MEAAGIVSLISVPLVARGRTLGVFTFFSTAHSGRRYTGADLSFGRELAHRAAMSMENARLYREAREAIRLRDEFLSIASHELKTPLTSLRLKVDGILRMAGKDRSAIDVDKLAARVQGVDKQLGRLTELVDALLDVSRAASGQLQLRIENVDLGAVVQAAAQRFKDDLASAGCSLSVMVTGPDGPRSPVFGRWDRLRLDEVVTNFLSNAIKYGAGKPIQIRLSATETVATIEVEDHGIGISHADQQRLFERFARVVSPDHYGGFGLGLWIVKLLVEAMGGKVAVRSAIGQGSVFSAELPRHGSANP